MILLQDVIDRREALLQRIAAQRQEIALQAKPLRRAADVFDRGYAIVKVLRRAPPALVIGAGVLTFVLVRKRFPIARMTSVALTVARWWLAFKARSKSL
jgi:YqjK-like protein